MLPVEIKNDILKQYDSMADGLKHISLFVPKSLHLYNSTLLSGVKDSHNLSADIISMIVTKDSPYAKYTNLAKKYIARPDILSKDIYGDSMYADLLCKLNGISNPFELNQGDILVIPSPDCIMNFMHTPDIAELDSSNNSNNSNSNKPIAKPKNVKRKANEAVIGDSRFKIDQTHGIVIY